MSLEGDDRLAHRNALAKQVFLTFLDKFAVEHDEDAYGMVTARMPVSDHGRTVDWHVAFDRKTAEARHAELITYTNPRFQRVLRSIGERPVLAIRVLRRATDPPERSPSPVEARELVATRFSYHITYETYGESRSETFEHVAGDLNEGNAIAVDVFDTGAAPLPRAVEGHHREARAALEAHLAKKAEQFASIAKTRMDKDDGMLKQGESRTRSYFKGDTEDDAYFRQAIERQRRNLDEKYAIRIHARLLAVEPFFEVRTG